MLIMLAEPRIDSRFMSPSLKKTPKFPYSKWMNIWSLDKRGQINPSHTSMVLSRYSTLEINLVKKLLEEKWQGQISDKRKDLML